MSDNMIQRFSKVFFGKKQLPAISRDMFDDPNFDFGKLLQGEAGTLYKGYLSSVGLGFSREALYRDYSMMCFTGDTLVTTADWEHISIKDIVEKINRGEDVSVLSYDIDRQEELVGKVIAGKKTREDALIVDVVLSNGLRVMCTPDHRFLLANGSYKEATKLLDTDQLRNVGLIDEILYADEINVVNHTEDVYDITVATHHNFALSAGVYVHNCESALPGGALNLYSDDSTQFDRENKATVWVTSDNPVYEKKIEQLFDIIGLEDVIWDWAFTVGGFGDLMLRVHGMTGVGITSIEDDIAPIDVQRVDVDGVLLGFFCSFMQEEMFMPWDWDHFRLMTTHKREWRGQAAQRSQIQITRTGVGPRITTKYGTSILEDARRSFKQLKLMEDTMIMARLSKSILRRMIGVDVGNMAPKKAASLINHIKTLFKKAEAIDTNQNTFSHSYSPLSVNEDIFYPVTANGKGKIDIEELGGDPDPKSLIDIEYLRQQVIGALKVPSAYLGYESELPGALGEGPLIRLDIRYARTVKKLQRALVNGLKRLAQIHLTYLGQDPSPELFDIHMSSVSTAEEAEHMKALSESSDTLDSFLGVLDNIGYDTNRRDNDYLLNYLISTGLLPTSDLDIEKLKKHKPGNEEAIENRDVKKDKNALDLLETILNKKGDILEKDDRDIINSMVTKIHSTLGGSNKRAYITKSKDLQADLPIRDNLDNKYIKEQQVIGKTLLAEESALEKLKQESELT